MTNLNIKHASLTHYDIGYIEYGKESMPPLIIMPAIISRLKNWNFVAEFMGQKFHTIMFDLPGHGESILKSEYHKDLLGQSLVEFADYLKFPKLTIMGFSFGGMLALESLKYLGDRVDNIILLAPVIDKDVIKISSSKRAVAAEVIRFLGYKPTSGMITALVKSRLGSKLLVELVKKFLDIDHPEVFRKSLRAIEKSAIESLAVQCKEVLELDDYRNKKYKQRCFYAVSKHDPMVDPQKSKQFAESIFDNIEVDYLDMPYHQPKEPYTLDYMNRKFGHLLQRVDLMY